ncbi:hypothetical protein [Streptomyces mirabilis]|uniref:hypothetical protein n=1 Tax=Streptomyces mirabilis TaxID=68239 RepID=UPI00380A40A3
MRRVFVAAVTCATALTAFTALSGCSSAASEQDASADVKVGICASEGTDPVLGPQTQWEYCAISVDNQSASVRAYTIDLACTSDERGAFDAGRMVYYVSTGQQILSSAGIATGATDQNLACRTGSATVQDLIPADGNPDPNPSPTGALAAALAGEGPGGTPAPVDTAAAASASEAAASASAQAEASASAAASASASAAVAAVQQRALARTYAAGEYSVSLSQANPLNTTTIDLLADVTSHDPNTGLAKQFGLVVTLLNADGSVNASGTMCGELLGGDSQRLEFTPQQGTTDWTSIHVSSGSTSSC